MAKEKEKRTVKQGTKIGRCACSNEYQDKRYGQGQRVFNLMKKPATGSCTSCGGERSIS